MRDETGGLPMMSRQGVHIPQPLSVLFCCGFELADNLNFGDRTVHETVRLATARERAVRDAALRLRRALPGAGRAGGHCGRTVEYPLSIARPADHVEGDVRPPFVGNGTANVGTFLRVG